MEEPKFIINTIMSKEDYRKFLYLATFKIKRSTFPLLALFALGGSILISLDGSRLNLKSLIVSWIFLFALAIMVVVIKIERRNTQRIKTDKTGTFDSINTLKFYDDGIVMENKERKSTGELKYDQFFSLMESKDYFIFYITVNQASLVRKKDIDDPNAFREFIIKKFEGRYKKA